ncbi:hypothetical protein GFS24_19630 [Chitinophaga sp. SYP-B3965]|uniref:hypothetical protein n=1 Tax=Chitinophaga sp. SYP-B3965 TaxID=2663120 RepID=UPI001299912B|nr:hypothetical protein [Chitinophaga sp. SYP-B3965]MRG47340.1 hypothetical protein [Chitinophaga sp. SYP-B3965]
MRYLLLLALFFSCNTAATNNQEDSSIVDGAKELLPVQPAPQPVVNPQTHEIHAQDTVFEDGSIPSTWANAGFDDPAGFKEFLLSFKDWVKKDQVDSITAYIRFPLKNYKTPEAFKKAYSKVFDESLKKVVETQRLDRIFRNYQGAMIGSGQIWFNTSPEGYKIIAINK